MDLPPCAQTYADFYDVPVVIMAAVREQEGGWPGAEIKNRNGTVDLGLMQINSAWFEPGNPVDLNARGITQERVRDNACLNVAISAWILNRYHHKMGYDWGRTLAAYNAGPGNWEAGVDYAWQVSRRIDKITKRQREISYQSAELLAP